jgi:hypothetical protein
METESFVTQRSVSQASSNMQIDSEKLSAASRIERQLIQVRDVFGSLASLTVQQGQTLTAVEANFTDSAENSYKTNKELEIYAAKRQQLKKWIWILSSILGLLVTYKIYRRF